MLASFHSGPTSPQGEDPDRKSALHRLQAELLILEQEQHKKARYGEALEIDLRKLSVEQDRLSVRMEDKKMEKERLSRELAMLEADMKRLKRKIALLS